MRGKLDKHITDLKAVEGWLRMNLSMLQMTIQSLEMQRTEGELLERARRQRLTVPSPSLDASPITPTAGSAQPSPTPARF